jgi:signal transduction histidine kinase
MAGALERRSRELEAASAALHKAYSEAAEKNRAYLETLGFVTHELKSPLASIVFGIGALRERLLGPLTPDQEAVLRSVAGSADYLTGTIANYLNLSRLEEGELRLNPVRLPFGPRIVRPLLERLAELLGEHGVRVDNAIPDDFEVRADEALLGSVMQNLVSNAVKYGRDDGLIRLSAEARADASLVSVWNEGPGFEPEAAERLFEKFSRLAEGRDTKAGTGLGLYVARRIVERHGGRLWARAEQGSWAEFLFTLPASPTTTAPGVASAATDQVVSG